MPKVNKQSLILLTLLSLNLAGQFVLAGSEPDPIATVICLECGTE